MYVTRENTCFSAIIEQQEDYMNRTILILNVMARVLPIT